MGAFGDRLKKMEKQINTGAGPTVDKLKTSPLKKQSALDVQVGGDHYKNYAIQPVEFITKNGIGFLPGCVIKRMARYNQPTGKGLQDLQKAIHEIRLMIELLDPPIRKRG